MGQRERERLLVALAAGAVVLAAGLAVTRGRAWRRPPGGRQASTAAGTTPAPGEVGRATAAAPPLAGEVGYTVVAGDTLGAIAARFGLSAEALAAANNLADPNNLRVGQRLLIRAPAPRTGPLVRTVPDSEVVFGPAYAGFDVAAEAARPGGYLASYSELVDGVARTGPEIVAEVARDFSVGPRVLLAVLEARGGWVTGSTVTPEAQVYPAGLADPARAGLWRQLNWLADQLNAGYYDWRNRGSRVITLADGDRLAGHPSLGPGSFAVQYALGQQGSAAELPALLAGFDAAYRGLFGDPAAHARPVPDLGRLRFPALQLPIPRGELWWLTGGPHGGWAAGSAWAAIDLLPEEAQFGCFTSSKWATAAADGVALAGGPGQLWLDLDGDGDRGTGPVLLYLHLAAEDRVAPGTRLRAGDRLGHPSCEGGQSEATHLHLARLYDGEWLAAAGQVPFELGDWTVTGGSQAYEGGLRRADGQECSACECRLADTNGIKW
jgi:LysM repeat protein